MKLNIGCGDRLINLDGWINVDIQGGCVVQVADVRNLSSAFEPNSIELIYASHVFEYFNEQEAIDVLRDWHGILDKGGVLRLAVPDFSALVKLYMETGSLANVVGPLYGRMVVNCEEIYHKMVYDYSTLAFLLRAVGFRSIRKWDWRKTEHAAFDDGSQAYFPHMDKETGMLLSLNVEGVKNWDSL